MGAQYYGADSENGDRIDDASEDADLTIWMVTRHHPGRPTSQVTDF
ncbi:hypothetical protein ABZ214_20380 [Streptomyces iakyrus]